MPRARILVVEDEQAILRGLLDVLVFHGFEPTGAATGEEGLASVASGLPDLVILDVMMPGLDGFAVCRRLRQRHPDLPILMLTAKGAEDDIVEGFNAGADDYVCKPFSLRELMVRIEALLRRSGHSPQSPPLDLGSFQLDPGNLRLTDGTRTVDLTRRECDILLHLHRHRERIVSRGEFLTAVWGYPDPEIETRTVDIHLQRLRKKLETLSPDCGKTLIETVRGAGYRLRPDRAEEGR